jgi:hypothetical protein
MSKTLASVMMVAAVALAVAGCGGTAAEDYERTSEAQAARVAGEVFRDPALRDALQLNSETAARFKNELDANALPGEAPVTAPAAAPAAAPATEPAAPAAAETPAAETSPAPATEAPAPETPATEAPAGEAPATETPAPEAPAAEGDSM